MKTLMATDGSAHAAAAMSSACAILSPGDNQIDLLCVVPASPRNTVLAQKMCRRATRILDAARKWLGEQGFQQARTLIKTGSPAKHLIRASENYDVTVIGATSRSSEYAGLGPVASRMVEHSHASILVGREPRNGPGLRILVAVDGSENSLSAIDKLTSIADMSEAEITLLHVVETPWLHAGLDQEWAGYEEEGEEVIDPQAQLQQEFVEEGEQVLQDAHGRFPVRTAVRELSVEGLPADEILAEAERGYDLVVVGAGAATDLKHKILGSVSAKVAWNAPCSVLIVRGA